MYERKFIPRFEIFDTSRSEGDIRKGRSEIDVRIFH